MMVRLRRLTCVALCSLALASGVALAQDTVRIAQSLAQNILSPAEATGLPDATVIRTMFEGLVGFTDGVLVPELASDWSANDDEQFSSLEGRDEGELFLVEIAERFLLPQRASFTGVLAFGLRGFVRHDEPLNAGAATKVHLCHF